MKRINPVIATPSQAVNYNLAKWREAKNRNKERYVLNEIPFEKYDRLNKMYTAKINAAADIICSSYNW